MSLLARPSLGLAIGLSLVIAAVALALLGPGDSTALTIAGAAGLGGLFLAVDAVGRLVAPAKAAAKVKSTSSWRIPAELDQPAPRRVRLKPIGWIAGILWLVVASLIAGVGELGLPRRAAQTPASELESAQAEVTDKSIRETSAGREHVLTLSFQARSGSRIRARIPVTRWSFHLTAKGDTYEAVYLRGDASRYVFPDLRLPLDRRAKYALYAAGLALLLLLEWIRRRERALLRHGSVASAAVENLKVRGASRAYDAVFRARGQTIRIPTTERSRTRAEGDQVTVLYRADNPKRASVYETSFYAGRG